MNYREASAEEITARFATISRQRIQQLIQKFQDRNEDDVVAKMQQAKESLRRQKYEAKLGLTVEQVAKARKLWRNIKDRVGKKASYMDCTIEWESEVAFREWAVRQVGFSEDNFELDKDVLVKGNRAYGPNLCAFIPLEINSLLSGCYKARRRGKYPIGVSFNKGSGTFVAQMSNRQEAGLDKYLGSFATVEEAFACYKVAKEAKIKKLAEKWRDRIDPRAYGALIARTVELDD